MRARLAKRFEQVRTSFWFLPSLTILGAIGLAELALGLDRADFAAKLLESLALTSDADGARSLLSTIAGAMATIAGVVFSITIVVLSLASQQFGPRIIRSIMADRVVQVALGAFIATFAFSLSVLARVDTEQVSAPFSLLLAVLMAAASVVVLVAFIHHIAAGVQAPRVVASVGAELRTSIERVLPDEPSQDVTPTDEAIEDLCARLENVGIAVGSKDHGYVQSVDFVGLVEMAQRNALQIRVDANPGDYVLTGGALVTVIGTVSLEEHVANAFRAHFALGSRRTPVQDLNFAISQLVEVAVRALSPTLNDPFTAVNAVDRLGEALTHIESREVPRRVVCDAEGRPRMVTRPIEREATVRAVFSPIRPFAVAHLDLVVRILTLCGTLHRRFANEAMRRSLRDEAGLLHTAALAHHTLGSDRKRVSDAYQSAGFGE